MKIQIFQSHFKLNFASKNHVFKWASGILTSHFFFRDYEDILNQEDIYTLLALSSCANRAFGTTSRAFIKLEALEELSPQQREEYEELAMDIFVKHMPKDSRANRSECASCETMIPDW